MARNGSGTYSLPAGNPVVTGTTISSTTQNSTMSDIATALTNSVAANGETPITANLPMSGYKHTGVAVGSALTDYARLDQTQNATPQWLTSISGADTIVGTAAPVPSAYAAGQTFRFTSAGANTGAVTLNISSLGAKAITKNGTTALIAGDIPSGAVVTVTYDGTQFQLKTDDIAAKTHAATSKATPVDADEIPIIDSAASNLLKKLTWADLKTTLGATFAALAGSASQAFSTAALTTAGLFDISGAAAGQIKFPAAQNASADANTLDDYEEGSWTPTIVGSSSAGTGTYTTQAGRYTKIGNLVFISGTIIWTAHTGTGNILIGGLPFTSNATNIAYGVGEWANLAAISGAPAFYLGISSAQIAAVGLSVTTGASAAVAMDTAASVFFSLTYRA